MIQGKHGEHFVIALPWANRRVRLSFIAKCFIVPLLVLTAMGVVAFPLRVQLYLAMNWLSTWMHGLIAYCVLVLLSFFLHALFGDSEKDYTPPSQLILLWPGVLLLVLLLFVSNVVWFVGLVLLLFAALWILTIVIIARCVPAARTVGWRFALITLAVALTLCDMGAVRSMWRFDREIVANRSDAITPFAESPISPESRLKRLEHAKPDADTSGSGAQASTSSKPLPNENTKSLGNTRVHISTDDHQRGPVPAKPIDTNKSANAARPDGHLSDDFSAESPNRQADLDSFSSRSPAFNPREQEEIVQRKLTQPTATGQLLEPRFDDLVSNADFLPCLIVSAICIAWCTFAMSFSWVLDFGLDVLNYGGNGQSRASMLDGLSNALRWLHSQAPGATLIVVGHSLGSVVASHAVSSVLASEPILCRITLVTLGSPLNYLHRLFPSVVKTPRELFAAICPKASWINLWRQSDPIGKAINAGAAGPVQFCIGKGGHLDYWSDGAVWRATAYETIGMQDYKELASADSMSASCLMEARLGLLLVSAITLLLICGTGLWILSSGRKIW